MNTLLELCLVGLATAVAPLAAAAQPLQAGIHVALPLTRHATAMPEADKPGASVLAITENGQIYLGITPLNSAALPDKIKSLPPTTLYLKADARVASRNVAPVLTALRAAGLARVAVLTDQPEPPAPARPLPPKGLDLLLAAPAGAEPAVIELLPSGQGRPEVKIGNERVSWDALPRALRGRKLALLKPQPTVPFGPVVELIDLCRPLGTQVVLETPAP